THPLFVVTGENATMRALPTEEWAAEPSCLLKLEITEEVPCWVEMVELFEAELGDLEPAALEQFKKAEWKKYPAARNRIKVGGWPYWIQSPEVDSQFVAQLVSSDRADLLFGDMGNLYVIGGSSAQSLTGFVQCY